MEPGSLRPPWGVSFAGMERKGRRVSESVTEAFTLVTAAAARIVCGLSGWPTGICGVIKSLLFVFLVRGREMPGTLALNLKSYRGIISVHICLTKKIAH